MLPLALGRPQAVLLGPRLDKHEHLIHRNTFNKRPDERHNAGTAVDCKCQLQIPHIRNGDSER